MIKTMILWLGGATAGLLAVGLMWLFAWLIKDGIACARFIWRLRQAAKGAGEPIKSSRLLKAWFRYWIGIDWRPDYLTLTTNNKAIYWPGKEGSRRYPA